MNKRSMLKNLAVAAAACALAPMASAQAWKPSKPINLIVPWAAGGSTDQITRVAAGELEKVLGQKIIVVNQPGASGSIGTKNAWDAPCDGYTCAGGAAGPESIRLPVIRQRASPGATNPLSPNFPDGRFLHKCGESRRMRANLRVTRATGRSNPSRPTH